MLERARPHADEIWSRLLSLAGGRAPEPGDTGEVPDPGGRALFPQSPGDAAMWDGHSGSTLERTWLLAVSRSLRPDAASGRSRGTG